MHVRGNLPLIPVYLQFVIRKIPPSSLAWFHACTCEMHLRGGDASQGSLNNCNLCHGMHDVASSRKQVSRPFPRRVAISHRHRARGLCVRARAPFDAISRMPEDGDAAVCRASYSVASSAGPTYLGTFRFAPKLLKVTKHLLQSRFFFHFKNTFIARTFSKHVMNFIFFFTR